MSVAVQWTDTDPVTGEKRFVSAERFGKVWRFQVRARRRDDWETPAIVTRDMLEVLQDAIQRRYQRREGVSDADLVWVQKALAALPPDDDETEASG
jgi:hypothetical protein